MQIVVGRQRGVRAWLWAMIRAWIPSWRFFDRPDYWIEVRLGEELVWRRMVEPQTWRWRCLGFNPIGVECMWCESRIRGHLKEIAERARMPPAQALAMRQLLGRLQALQDGPSTFDRWSLRCVDACDRTVRLVIASPPAARESAGR